MPINRIEFSVTGVNLHSYFAGLLPEGLRIRALTQKLKTSEDDLLTLLIAGGSDCIGDISVVRSNTDLQDHVSSVDIKNISQVEFKDLLKQSLSYNNLSSSIPEPSIPGIQEKISASTISLPIKGKGTSKSFILKLNSDERSDLVENENFFLQMAKACGIKTAKASIVKDKAGESGLLVERFDRIPDLSSLGDLIKIHQEDACQFLDRYPADKYRILCSEIIEGIQKYCTSSSVETAKFIRLLAFSYLIANGDMHAKNISISIDPLTSRIELTPAYDLFTTLPYGDQKMALKFEGRNDNIKAKDYYNFAKRYGVPKKIIDAILTELFETSESWIKKIEEIGFNEKRTLHLQKTMLKRRAELLE